MKTLFRFQTNQIVSLPSILEVSEAYHVCKNGRLEGFVPIRFLGNADKMTVIPVLCHEWEGNCFGSGRGPLGEKQRCRFLAALKSQHEEFLAAWDACPK